MVAVEKVELKAACRDLVYENCYFSVVADPESGEPVLNLKLAGKTNEEIQNRFRPIIDSFVEACKTANIKIPRINFYG
jgi:hypothetical protein